MFVLFGRKAKVHKVSGGRQEKRRCPACHATTTFVEHEKKSSYSLYLVELFDDTERVFVCSACGEAMSIDETQRPELSAPERVKQAKEAEKEAAKIRKTREAARKRQEKELDDELAALKRKVRDER